MEQNLFFVLKSKKKTKFLYDNMSFPQGLEMMREHGFTAVPVINQEGEYVGSLDQGDFLYYLSDHPNSDLDGVFLRDLIRPGFMPAVPFNVGMGELLARSLEQNYVPVVDDRNVFIGLVTRKAILKYLMEVRASG